MYLFIGGERCKQWNDVTLEVVQLQDFSKLAQLGGGGSPHHGGVVGAQGAEVPAKSEELDTSRRGIRTVD